MRQYEPNGSGPEPNSEPPQREPEQDVWEELQRAQLLASQVSHWGGSMFNLAWLELQLALQSVPKMIGLLLALVPISGMVWITLTILLAWFAYDATQLVAVGLGTLFGLQLILMLLCMWQIKRLRARSSFRETRQQWQLFLQEIQNREPERDDKAGNHH